MIYSVGYEENSWANARGRVDDWIVVAHVKDRETAERLAKPIFEELDEQIKRNLEINEAMGDDLEG
jgi:hypothetical protein